MTASHREIAARVSDELVANESVEAIFLVGSVSLGYADEYSDVDLQVVGSLKAGDRRVDGVHVEWTPVTADEIEGALTDWEDDAARYTYANAEVLHDEAGVADLLDEHAGYPPDVRREKLFSGWFHGTGEAFDARKAAQRGDQRAQVAAAVAAVEQFVALAYVLQDRVPPYRSWLFRDVPMDLPEIDDGLSGDVDALTALSDALEPDVRRVLDSERIEHPYRFQPEFGPLG